MAAVCRLLVPLRLDARAAAVFSTAVSRARASSTASSEIVAVNTMYGKSADGQVIFGAARGRTIFMPH